MARKGKTRSMYFGAYTQFFLTIASGATPIGSAGRAPDDIVNFAIKKGNYGVHIGQNY
jgi:hypothetical protein